MNRLQKVAAKWMGLDISQKAAPGSYPTYSVLNGNIIQQATNGQHYLNKGFNSNDIVFAATQLISEKVKLAPWRVYKVNDEGALEELKRLKAKGEFTAKDFKKAQWLQAKALTATETSKLTELLKYPNENDTFQDLVANSSINKLLLGSRFIHADLLKAGANQGKPQSFELLPSQSVTLVVSKTWPFRVLGYVILEWTDKKTFTREEIMHDKYYNPNFDINGNHLHGFAPMQSAELLLDRSNSENMATATAFHNQGVKKVIWVDYVQGMEFGTIQSQIEAVKDKLSGNGVSGPRNYNKNAYSGYKMGATAISDSPADLGIMDSEKSTLRRICNVIGGLPSQLLNDPENKIYSNMQEGEKALTTRAAVPLLNSWRDQFNRCLSQHWGYKGENLYTDYDISVYSELQEDLGKKWTWVKELPVPNGYKLDMMGLDHPEGQDDFMGKILVPSNYATSDDFTETETDRALEEGDGEAPEDEGGV